MLLEQVSEKNFNLTFLIGNIKKVFFRSKKTNDFAMFLIVF